MVLGAGGWIGPRSRFGNWTNRRWWHFHVSLGVAGMLVTFPVGYFGVVSDRSEHQFFPSLVGAIAFGWFVGLGCSLSRRGGAGELSDSKANWLRPVSRVPGAGCGLPGRRM
jgi:hypothetical protein